MLTIATASLLARLKVMEDNMRSSTDTEVMLTPYHNQNDETRTSNGRNTVFRPPLVINNILTPMSSVLVYLLLRLCYAG